MASRQQNSNFLLVHPNWIFGAAVVLAGMVLTLVFLYPGHINGDTLNQYQQGVSESYNDWYPPLMSFVWHLIHVIRLPIFPFNQMFLLTAFMFWIGLASIVILSFPTNKSACLPALLIGLYPAVFLILNYIVKDTFFACALLCSYAMLLRSEKSWNKWYWCAGMFGLTFTVGVRHNAILAVIPLVAWAAVIFKSKCKMEQSSAWMKSSSIPLITALMSAAMLLINIATSDALVRQHHSYPIQQVLLFDLVGLSVATQKDLMPTDYPFPELEGNSTRLSLMNQLYHPETCYPLYWDGLEINRIKLHRLPQTQVKAQVDSLYRSWWAGVKRFPWLYLTNRAKVMKALLGAQRYDYEGDDPSPREYLFAPETILSDLRLTFLTSGWPYMLLLVVLGISHCARWIKLSSSNLALWASASIYAGAYFFIGVDYETRYLFWPIVATTFLVLRLAGEFVAHGIETKASQHSESAS